MSSKDYSNGKIYKIINSINDHCYIGSTTQLLSKRMSWHRDAMKNVKVNHRALYAQMIEHGSYNFYIELVEDYPCESSEHLRKREGELIREFGTLNTRIEDRTKQERSKIWRQEHKEETNASSRKSKLKHRDRILEERRNKRQNNLEEVREKDREWYHNNKDKIQEQAKEWKATKLSCSCGGKYTNAHKAEHLKSQRHVKYTESNETAD